MGPNSRLIFCTVCCAAIAAEVFGNHRHPHALERGPVFPLIPWGAHSVVIGTSTTASM
jgi:hypothetical protein